MCNRWILKERFKIVAMMAVNTVHQHHLRFNSTRRWMPPCCPTDSSNRPKVHIIYRRQSGRKALRVPAKPLEYGL